MSELKLDQEPRQLPLFPRDFEEHGPFDVEVSSEFALIILTRAWVPAYRAHTLKKTLPRYSYGDVHIPCSVMYIPETMEFPDV